MSLEKSTIFKNIFFDFDGVLAESVNAKTQAFKELYLPYGNEIVGKVVEHHINHGGVSRFEKFKIYHREFLGVNLSEEKVNELAQNFSDLVLEKVINSEDVKGSIKFIKKYYKSVRFWIITGTPNNEMNIIANKRHINSYFVGIHGSPKNKKYWTEYLIAEHNLKREETLFLGDAITDYEAAIYSNLHFALREHTENKSIFLDYEGIRFKDFVELDRAIETNLI